MSEFVIDPNFSIPAGLNNARYRNMTDLVVEPGTYISLESEEDVPTIIQGENLSPGNQPLAAQVPILNSVVSQTIRVSPDGSQVVDVVLDIVDIPNLTNIEIRKTIV